MQIAQRCEMLLKGIVETDRNLFSAYPLAEFEARLDATPRFTNYSFQTDAVQAWWKEIEHHGGVEAIALYNRALLLYLLSRFDDRASTKEYPDSILEMYEIEFERIIDRVQQGAEGRFAVNNDLFLKDLGISRQILFPVENGLFEEAGLPRNILWRGGVAQFFRYAWYLLFIGRGRKPWYEGHLHLDATNFAFTAEERDKARFRLVDMFNSHPQVKGYAGSAWFHDPALKEISPAVGEGTRQICTKGGRVFRVGPDNSGGAFVRSETRKRLYAEGKYSPTTYLLLWSRRDMINWAEEKWEERDAK